MSPVKYASSKMSKAQLRAWVSDLAAQPSGAVWRTSRHPRVDAMHVQERLEYYSLRAVALDDAAVAKHHAEGRAALVEIQQAPIYLRGIDLPVGAALPAHPCKVIEPTAQERRASRPFNAVARARPVAVMGDRQADVIAAR